MDTRARRRKERRAFSCSQGLGKPRLQSGTSQCVATIVNQLARIVNKSPFYNFTECYAERHPYEIYRPFSSVSL